MAETCSICTKDREISDAALRANILRNGGFFVCRSCKTVASPSYKATRNKNFWNNPQSQTPEARAKRAASQRGKFGAEAHAWKGGAQSLNVIVKKAVYRRHGWAKKIYERDGWKCVKCESTDRLDAHHTTPFSVLLKNITVPDHLAEGEMINWPADHPTLVSADGMTDTASCHRAVHANWGSHYAEATS